MLSRRIDRDGPDYPPALLALPSPPATLRLRGSLPARPAVAIVGTRTPSEPAARYAFELAAALGRAGVAVWSGGALGIDEQAHRGALHAGAPTVLVAGGGLERPYPAMARSLWGQVLEGGGALLSLVDDQHPALRWTFLNRNAALAALTAATVLIECPLQSGARNTTAAARKLGRPVWIVPQAPWTPWAPAVREELRLGARPLLHPDDLLSQLGMQPAAQGRLPLDDEPPVAAPGSLGARLLTRVAAGTGQLDQLCEQLGEPAAVVLAEATRLLLEGALEEPLPGVFKTQPARLGR